MQCRAGASLARIRNQRESQPRLGRFPVSCRGCGASFEATCRHINVAWCRRRAPFFFLAPPRPPGGLRYAHICFLWGQRRVAVVCFLRPWYDVKLPKFLRTTTLSGKAPRQCAPDGFRMYPPIGRVAARGIVGAGQQRVGGANKKRRKS